MDTLIVYVTKHGAAEKCAAMLKERLLGKVDLHNLKSGNTLDLKPYDAVIIGGSIYAGIIQKEIKEFCTLNLNELKNKKLGLYICCMVAKSAEMQLNSSYPQELLDNAVVKDSFGGEMRISDMNFAEKLITRMVSKMSAKSESGMPAIDMKKDISMLSEDKVNSFAAAMNKVLP